MLQGTLIVLLLSGMASCQHGSPDTSKETSGRESPKINKTVNLLSDELVPQWVQKGGEAKFEVIDGVLVGTSRPNTPNSFFCPPERYANFELEFEVMCEPRLNSGVQIRSSDDVSDVNDQMPKANRDRIKKILGKQDRMFGPQVEIAANGNAGGVWFEVGRGWLAKPDAERGKTIYRNDGWNHYRIIAKGPRIQVFVNGRSITDMVDETTFMEKGYLGFQVHSVGYAEPSYVRWRNIRLTELP
jgi:hypothetical protein